MIIKKFTQTPLQQNTKNFKFSTPYIGWGRKKSGYKAMEDAKKNKSKYLLLEDGFIRSLGLGVEGYPTFSIVEDDIGIYYDATAPSKLENILNDYNFTSDTKLLDTAQTAINLIKNHHISKYNNFKDITEDYLFFDTNKKVLIIAQTAADSSLEYGLGYEFTTDEMIQSAIEENPTSTIYIKIHPDVLSGKKDSDIDIDFARKHCEIIDENINPISLLKHFDTVYTKTSQMGFEALIVGCKCVCFGVPFYSNWGITDDRIVCKRREKKLTVQEVFAGAYILYSRYYNPYKKRKSDILDTINTIIELKDKNIQAPKKFQLQLPVKLKKILLYCREYKRVISSNNIAVFFDIHKGKNDKKVAICIGFSEWKREYIKEYLSTYTLYFTNHRTPSWKLIQLLETLHQDYEIFVWSYKDKLKLRNYFIKNKKTITRVEDGFIRSIGLGVDETKPLSLVFDNRGLYFNSQTLSNLEYILSYKASKYSNEKLTKAKILIEKIVSKGISKYNFTKTNKTIEYIPKNTNIVLVIGQVEDDMSIKYGCSTSTTNLELLQKSTQENKNSFIIYKPHPDTLTGLRRVVSPIEECEKFCDVVDTTNSLDELLKISNHIYTITSLSGFEALLYSKKVTCFGTPFYSGWGLTDDRDTQNLNRKVSLSLEQLFYATYVEYPKYIMGDIETTLNYIEKNI